MRMVSVGRVEDFEVRGKKVLSVDGIEVGVFRLDDGFYAWRNSCPHQGGPVCQGRIYNRVRETLDPEMKSHGRHYDEGVVNIVCPWHGLEFDIRTGRHPGAAGMALERARVEVRDGEVHVAA